MEHPIERFSDEWDEMHRRSTHEHATDHLKSAADDIELARQYHAQHGVWPPDPLLDEVDDMRRQIMAEHGNDWRKVLA
ncbi:MAG TPA: hypothetical protein VLK84_30670 [Longimicrobium sp.]|nr:hypothetical protein [Longimicrobium sp.]